MLLQMVALLAAALFADTSQAQVARRTTVFGIVANYTDTRLFPGGPQTLRQILTKVHDFYAEGSGGAHEFAAEVLPTLLELPQARPAGKCQLPDMDKLSAMLREAGVNLNGHHALALVVPPSALGCPGGVQTSFHHRQADGTVRRVPLAVSWSLTERYVAHEILHTHGLGHANTLVCPKATLAANCSVREYGNFWDLMGHDGSNFQMISAPLRAHLGWTEAIVHGAGRATYTIGATTRSGSLPTALRIRLPFAGNGSLQIQQPLTLWIEYRAPYGFDKRMDGSGGAVNFTAGAMVNLTGAWQVTTGARTYTVACPLTSPCLLDMTPQTPQFNDAGITEGQAWTEPFTGTRIAVESRTDTTLTISVSNP